jgi:hypothetical protein
MGVLREVADEEIAVELWKKPESLYMKKSFANRLYLKHQLYTLKMNLCDHLANFNRIILNLKK